MQDYNLLKDAVDSFRELFKRKLLNINEIAHSKEFLKTITAKTADQYTYNDAFRVYGIIKPYATKLKMVGFDFNTVPPVALPPKAETASPVPQQNIRVIGYDGTRFVVNFSFRPNIYEAVKEIPGREWDANKKFWYVPLRSVTQLKQFALGFNFEIGDKAYTMMNNIHDNLEQSYSAEYIELGLPVKRKFYGYQTVGVKYMATNLGTINADQMRLGKTCQAIGAVLMTNTFPNLTIVPKSLRLNWKNEWEVWTNKRVIILDKNNAPKLKYLIENNLIDVVITNFDGVQTFFVDYIKKVEVTKGERAGTSYDMVYTNGLEKLFVSAILDEGHHCRNTKTIRYKAIKKCFDGKKARYVLTGTPYVKGPQDLAALFEIIGTIDHFGGRHNFLKVYKDMDKKFLDTGNGQSSEKNKSSQALQELNIKMRSLCFIRRERWQVPNATPEKFRSIIKVELENRADYDHAEFSLQSYLANHGASTNKIHSAMQAELLVKYGLLKQISSKGKINALKEHVESVLLEGEKIVICCWFNETVQQLKDDLKIYKPVTICGRIDGREMKDAEIEANKLKFNTDPECGVIIITYGKGGEGHNLGAANHCAVIELGWTNKDQDQIEDRSVVVGKTANLVVTYFIGQDTLDEHIYNIIESRRLVQKEGTGGKEEIETTFSVLTRKMLEGRKPVGDMAIV